MMPVSEEIRSRGTTRWMPFDALTLNSPRESARAWTSSVQTPVALTTTPVRTMAVAPVSVSRRSAPVIRPPSRTKPTTSVEGRTVAPYAAAVRASVRVWRASSHCAS